MARLLLFGLLFLPGCSNAPIAGTLDCIFPSRVRPSPTVVDPDRERPPDVIRPKDRSPLPPVEPYPFDDPRRGDRSRLADPISRPDPTGRPDPTPRRTDADLPLLEPPAGRDDLLPPPGRR